jgi:membrane-associated phospholipid phosphatase
MIAIRCPTPILAGALAILIASPPASAQQTEGPVTSQQADVSQLPAVPQDERQNPSNYGLSIQYPRRKGLFEQTVGDAKAYFTAPLHWNARDWEYFGGALGAIVIAHQYDTQVRNHFDAGYPSRLGPPASGTLSDALPGAALFVGTWGYATLIGSHAGHVEAWNMLESGGLSFVSTYAFKYIFRRQRPDATTSPNQWFASGGDSLPSGHVTAAFAVGTVLAESGNPEFRWIRRTIGYGVGVFTAYQRMKHNAHWLSDTVASAALGIASAHFVLDRSNEREQTYSSFSVVPVQGGAMLAYSADFND